MVGEPFLEVRKAVDCWAAVGGNAVDIRLALELRAHVESVTHRNRIADQHHARQSGHVLDLRERRTRGALGGCLGFLLGGQSDTSDGTEQSGNYEPTEQLGFHARDLATDETRMKHRNSPIHAGKKPARPTAGAWMQLCPAGSGRLA